MAYGILNDAGAVIARFVAPMTVRSNSPVFLSDSLSLSRYVSRRPPQRWEVETRLMPLIQEANELFVHFVDRRYTKKFQIMTPQNYGVMMARTVVDDLASVVGYAGEPDLTVSAVTGFVPKGTFLRFGNHSKVYMTTADLYDGPSGQTMGVFPALMTDVFGETIYYRDDVRMDVYFDRETLIGMGYTDGITMDNEVVRMVEYVPKLEYAP